MIEQYVAHGHGGQREKACAVQELLFALIGELQKGLVDECGGLQRVVFGLPLPVRLCDAVQLVVDQGHQFIEGALVASGPRRKQSRHIAGLLHVFLILAHRLNAN